MPSRKIIIFLTLTVILGGFLRIWSLGSTEHIHDEGLDIFRSIGYVDYLDSDAQSTPIQWLKDKPLPWWTHLSFHDDPPLFFIVQHIFISVFGETLFAARLPSALAGLGSIILVFFIVRRLLVASSYRADISEYAGLVAAFMLSINFAHIWVSRIAILESLVIFLVLLNIYFFLRFIENPKRWAWFGITLGLSWLVKYTSIFMLPVYLVYMLVINRSVFKKRNLYFALVLAFLVFSPVIVYNICLYQTFGHFDLQVATLLHQNVSYWQGESGKTQEPFTNIKENLLSVYSPILLFCMLLGMGVVLFAIVRKSDLRKHLLRISVLFYSLLASTTLLLVFIGSAMRFVVLYAPSVVVLSAIIFIVGYTLAEKSKKRWVSFALIILFILLVVSECVFTISTMLSTYGANFGVNMTNRYFDEQFNNKRPLGLLQLSNSHLNDVIKKYAVGYPNTLTLSGIIYDDNIGLTHRLWLFSRRELYHGIPIMPASTFLNTLQKEGGAQFAGYTLYFVKADIGGPVRSIDQFPQALQFESFLNSNLKISPNVIFYDDAGIPAIRIYKFEIKS